MPTWLWVLVLLAGTVVAAFFLLLLLTGRRSDAGIVTSRLGRTLRLMFDGGLMSLRYGRRWVRRLFTSKAKREELERRFHDETARAALETMGNMKGALMKLGQIVSFMDETLPPEYQEHLRALQCQAPPMSFETVARVLQQELGHAPERLFAELDEKPLASASIGQVHRALLWDGTEVAVKVQYPGVDQAIAADLGNVGLLIAMIGAVTPTLDARPLAEELRERLLEELDYEREAQNQELFGRLYADHETVIIPAVVRSHCSRRVLTTTLVRGGLGFYDFTAKATLEEKRAAVSTLYTFVFDSMFIHHVFNGDPHPGNYLFLDNGKVAFLDFGCVKRFNPRFIEDFQTLNRHYLLGERDAYFAKACAMGFIRAGHEHKVDREWLWDWARWFYLPILEEQPFRFTHDYCKQALGTIFGENMRLLNMPAEYVMMNRITFGLNSILAKLDACEDWRTRSLRYYFNEAETAELRAKDAQGAR